MKKSFIKNLLDRRFPQIVGSYFVGATSLLLFLDWLVVKYHLSDFVTSLALFGVISIVPTVVILAYFHGAPGKDEWTRVERYGIPANIIFIAIALFVGNKYNLWEDAAPDHSKVYDSFLINIKSTQKYIDDYMQLDEWESVSTFADSMYPVSSKKLKEIQNHIYPKLRQEFINNNITIIFPENEEEEEYYKLLPGWDAWNLPNYDGSGMYESNDYFNDKHSTKIDWVLSFDIFEAIPSKKAKFLIGDTNENTTVISFEYVGFKDYIDNDNERSSMAVYRSNTIFDVNHIKDDNIKEQLLEFIISILKDFTFGDNVGIIENVLDSNLVTIKLNKPELMRGTDLVCLEKNIIVKTGDNTERDLNKHIHDYKRVYDYYQKNQNEIIPLYDIMDWDYIVQRDDIVESISEGNRDIIDEYLKDISTYIDSLKTNMKGVLEEFNCDDCGLFRDYNIPEYRYYLRILNVQDSIATAKITGKVGRFSYPEIGDKINLK